MKKRLTKLCSVVMALMLALACAAFVGCGEKPNTPPADDQGQEQEQPSAPAISDVVEVEGGKIRGTQEG